MDLNKLGLPYWARINFIIYKTWTWKILELPYNLFDFRYIGLGLEKRLYNLTGVRLIL